MNPKLLALLLLPLLTLVAGCESSGGPKSQIHGDVGVTATSQNMSSVRPERPPN